MQTFLPCADFTASARTLERRRLGKQRVEALQVLRALVVPGYGWRHHPAAKMWTGYEEALTRYGLEVCAVWRALGAADTCAVKLADEYVQAAGGAGAGERASGAAAGPAAIGDLPSLGSAPVRTQAELAATGDLPPWLGDEALHRSHQSALVRKDPDHYATQFPDVSPDLPYVWPPSDRPRRTA
ncbi:MSMEG_6728 family protein [Amycolatopsis sp. NPDC051061]|uniref:MSMEG_6728 family protein n=1 Tax=Amycolatopsis sp. NPDC051061 TaxID=3155042 RepID=UPI003435DF4B